MTRVSSRLAVITGGSGAVGTALSQVLHSEGYTVCTLDLAPASLDTDHHFVVDVSDEAEVDRAFSMIEDEIGIPDALINTAYVMRRGLATEFGSDDWDLVMRVNVKAYWLSARRAARTWLAQPDEGRSIVNLSSITGASAVGRGGMAYGVSKAAVLHLTRELAVEWAASGIRVNAVQPAQVDSPGLSNLLDTAGNEGLRSDIMAGIPMGRLVSAHEVARAVSFLLSDSASFITGASLPVDGGNLSLNAGGTTPKKLQSVLD